MPKVSVSLQSAKAKDADILAKLSKVERASQYHKQQTRLNQQRLEWTEQSRRLALEAKRLDDDLCDIADSFGFLQEFSQEEQAGEESNLWLQVSGIRQLLEQVRRRKTERLRQAPAQALSLQSVLASVSAALHSQGAALAAQVAAAEADSRTARQAVHGELVQEGVFTLSTTGAERHDADICTAISDEEDSLMDRLGCDSVYGEDLQRLNVQVTSDLATLDKDASDLRRKCAGWNEEANYRFVCIKREFQGRSRELFVGRLCMEFPHLSREQLQAHESALDALKYNTQRRAAAFRQWRRDRLSLLRRHQSLADERARQEEAQVTRRQELRGQRERQRQLHSRLELERQEHAVRREARQRSEDATRRKRESEEQERERAQRRRAQELKEQAKEIGEKKRHMKALREEEEREREHREAEQRQRRMEHNAEIVRMRRAMDELKAKEQSQQRQAAEDERRERERRLQEAVEKLRVEAARDPERLHKVPARCNVEAYNDPLTCVTRGPACGFDEKRLMADARYKLAAALQAAGLFGTRAGHEALASVAAPRPAQPHIVSQVFIAGYPS